MFDTHACGIFRKIQREEFRQCPVLIISVSDWQFIAWHRHVELTLVRSLQFSALAASWQRRPATQKTNGPRILMKGCIAAPQKKNFPFPLEGSRHKPNTQFLGPTWVHIPISTLASSVQLHYSSWLCINQFSRCTTAHGYVQQTDHGTSITTGRIFTFLALHLAPLPRTSTGNLH